MTGESDPSGPIWVEAALNGGWGRDAQPGLPVSVQDIVREGIDCVRAGAAIVHVHAYDRDGRPSDDPEIYAAIIEGIRGAVDAIVYPTITFAGGNPHAHVEPLAKRGLLEWISLDTGSVNLSHLADIAQDRPPGSIYGNGEDMMRLGYALAAEYGIHASHACYEPGFVRMAAAIARRFPRLPQPIYRLMFSDGIAFGLPPRPYALAAYLELLADEAPGAPVMIAGLDADLSPIVPAAVAAGVHLRAGLEDARLGTGKPNAQLVEELVERIDGRAATVDEIRRALAAGTVA